MDIFKNIHSVFFILNISVLYIFKNKIYRTDIYGLISPITIAMHATKIAYINRKDVVDIGHTLLLTSMYDIRDPGDVSAGPLSVTSSP